MPHLTQAQFAEPEPILLRSAKDPNRFFKVTLLNQTWVRYNQSNPGTQVLGQDRDHTFDIGLRRTRLTLTGQLSRRVMLFFQLGQNNFNFLSGYAQNRKLQIFFHDAVGEVAVVPDRLKIGGGLTIANGLSRFSQPSVGNILALDVPIFAQATVDQIDNFSRKLSLYARGQLGKLDYRVSLSDPFAYRTSPSPQPIAEDHTQFAQSHHRMQYQTYMAWNFFESEPNASPYMKGCYLGRKKILNLGAGLIYQPEAMWKLVPLHTGHEYATDTAYHDMILWAVEAFADLPLNPARETALTAYLGFFDYDFGPHYLRSVGVMNPADGMKPGQTRAIGPGNAYPMMGTGYIWHSEAGLLLPKHLLGGWGTLQPYLTATVADFDRLADPALTYSLGVNWLMLGQHIKCTLDYQNRTVYQQDVPSISSLHAVGHRSSIVLQLQLSI